MTRRSLLLLVVLVLFVPTASAQTPQTVGCAPAVSEHRVELVDTGDGMDVRESFLYSYSGTIRQGEHANLTIRMPRDAADLTGTLDYQNGSSFDIPAESLTLQGGAEEASEPFVAFSTANMTDAPAPDEFRVEIAYALSNGETFAKTTSCSADSLVVFATPAADTMVLAPNLGTFSPVGDGRVHVAPGTVGAGFPIVASFLAEDTVAPGTGVQDLTPYVWGLAGLVVGLFLMYVVVKQGWVQIRREKKFEKGGRMESPSMLEARRRTLMAALKELEQAHEAKEVPEEAYSPLKEEYKAQAVRVLRSLEKRKEPSEE